jgi:hypothetical protein
MSDHNWQMERRRGMRLFIVALLVALTLTVVPTATPEVAAACSFTVSGLDIGYEVTHQHRPYWGTKFNAITQRKYTWVVSFAFNDGSTYVHNGNGAYSTSVTAPVPVGATSVTWLNKATTLYSGRHWGNLFGPELTVVNKTGTAAVTC